MKHFIIYAGGLFVFLLSIHACDSTTAPDQLFSDQPAIIRLSVTPQQVQFDPISDGIRDTTVQVHIEVEATGLSDSLPSYTITNRFTGKQVLQGNLASQQIGNYFSTDLSFDTRTTLFKEYIVNVYAYNREGRGNYAQASLNLTGFSVQKPVILYADNPESVQRPESGSSTVSFKAKATDPEGQATIEGVYLRLISRESGEVANSPFRLFDNGQSGGDEAAGDSVYTLTFPYDSGNQLQTYDILYYATDKGGLVSDTVRTTFSITE